MIRGPSWDNGQDRSNAGGEDQLLRCRPEMYQNRKRDEAKLCASAELLKIKQAEQKLKLDNIVIKIIKKNGQQIESKNVANYIKKLNFIHKVVVKYIYLNTDISNTTKCGREW